MSPGREVFGSFLRVPRCRLSISDAQKASFKQARKTQTLKTLNPKTLKPKLQSAEAFGLDELRLGELGQDHGRPRQDGGRTNASFRAYDRV